MMLDKCDGPACPRCGCQDAKILAEPPQQRAPLVSKAQQFYGTASWFAGGRARCKHCGLTFSFRELPSSPEDPPEEPRQPEDERQETGKRGQEPAADPLAGLAFVAETTVPQGIPPVTYPVKACPECGSAEIRVATKRGRIRHHQCRACSARFKSVESL